MERFDCSAVGGSALRKHRDVLAAGERCDDGAIGTGCIMRPATLDENGACP
jgi:hypothetical protein